MSKVRVAVLRGGPSEEYEVSLNTGAEVLSALDLDRFEPIDVVIAKNGEWHVRGFVRSPHTILQSSDVVFNALHGAYGEDGEVQRLLERIGVPYTGSRSYESAIAMNKAITKDKLHNAGVHFARHMVVGKSSLSNADGMARSITTLFGPRYIVKPLAGGSSVGTVRANNEHELSLALRKSLEVYDSLLVEEFIEGREATCGVVEHFRNHSLYALPVIEIVPPQDAEFFDYDAKYSGKSQELCPSSFPLDIRKEIERAAKYVHEHLKLRHCSRSDFIVTRDGIYFLEVNTLPGLTRESLIPKALEAVGCSYNDFIDHLLTRALHETPHAMAAH